MRQRCVQSAAAPPGTAIRKVPTPQSALFDAYARRHSWEPQMLDVIAECWAAFTARLDTAAAFASPQCIPWIPSQS